MTAWDAHVHLLDPVRFPFTDLAHYLPLPNECGGAAELLTVHAAHGIDRAVVVGPTAGYGRDNQCLIAALAGSGGRWRGIAVVAPDADDAALDALGSDVVGIRLDLVAHGAGLAHAAARSGLLDRLRARDWVVQVQAGAQEILDAAPALRGAGRLVFDHLGRPDPGRSPAQPGFAALLELGRGGGAWIKLSGADRWAGDAWPHPAADPFVAAVLDAFTIARCVWGSDWPFLRSPGRMDYGPVRALLDRWVPDPDARRAVLMDTPARLFGP